MSFHSHFIVAVLFVCLFSCVGSVSSVVETSVTSKADAHPVPQPCRQVLIWDQLRGPDSCGYNNNNNNNTELSWSLQDSQVYVSSVYEWKSYFALFRCVSKAALRCTFCRCVCQLVARRRWWTAHDHVLGIFHWKHSRKHFYSGVCGFGSTLSISSNVSTGVFLPGASWFCSVDSSSEMDFFWAWAM